MVIRRLLPEEYRLAFEAIRVLKRPEASLEFSLTTARRFLSKPENVLIVASSEGEPAGFLVAYLLDRVDRNQPMVCLYEIGVSEDFRRHGVGRGMIDVLKDLCGHAGVMKTWTITHRSNQAAVKLYQSTGARPGPGGDDVIFVWGSESWTGGR